MSYVYSRLTDKAAQRQKKRVTKLMDKWFKPIGLGWWKVHLDWANDIVPEKEDGLSRVGMTCLANWKYKEATITVNLKMIEDVDDEELEYMLVHEFMHIFINEMREEGLDHEERVATELANAMIWAVQNVGGGEK